MKQIVDKLNKIAKAIDSDVTISNRKLIIDSLDSITKAFGGTPNDSKLIVDKLEDIANYVHGGGGLPFLTATIINNTGYNLSNVSTCAPKAEYGVDFNQIPVPATSTEIKEYLYEFMGNDSYIVRLYFEGVGVSQVTISYSNLVNCTLNQADGWLDITDPSENASATLTLTRES